MAASALVLVLEGMLPFLSPARYRTVMVQVLALGDVALRRLGLLSMIAGVLVLYSGR
jgi:uncharacterized protein YjeT (DUF2065 family)